MAMKALDLPRPDPVSAPVPEPQRIALPHATRSQRFALLAGVAAVLAAMMYLFASILLITALTGCSGTGGRTVDTSGDASGLSAPRNHLLGEDRSATGGDQTQAGVNAYLWRGAIDTLSFMPFASADPVGGIIITDWYTPPTTSGERFKATAYVLGKQLRSDAIRVAILRQTLDG